MSIKLANFDKYAISECPFISCQNLASMLVGRVFTCQNYHFGKHAAWSRVFVSCQKFDFGKYVRWQCLSVCLSVCLFVRKFHKISRAI